VKQEVFVVGNNLRDLVPFGLTFMGPDYSITLVEAADIIERATALASTHEAWFLLLLSGDEDPEACKRLEALAPTTSIVIEDGEDPLIALAHLIAAATWETSAAAQTRASTAVKAEEPYG